MKWSQLKFFKEYWPHIKTFLEEEREKGKTILPLTSPEELAERVDGWRGPALFNAFIYTPRDKVKVVILGQDPYPNKEHAMGLAFGVPWLKPGVSFPPTLKNIFKELYDDLGEEHLNLSITEWARQGVLMLNTSLTVEEGKPGSHAYIGWKELTKEVLETVSTDHDGVVFILWGNYAQQYEQYIHNKRNHMIIKSAHPSPLSAHRGFFGSKPFSKTNCFLEAVGKEPIHW